MDKTFKLDPNLLGPGSSEVISVSASDAGATLWVTGKAKRLAEQISKHLPGMVGDMMSYASSYCEGVLITTEIDSLKAVKNPTSHATVLR